MQLPSSGRSCGVSMPTWEKHVARTQRSTAGCWSDRTLSSWTGPSCRKSPNSTAVVVARQSASSTSASAAAPASSTSTTSNDAPAIARCTRERASVVATTFAPLTISVSASERSLRARSTRARCSVSSLLRRPASRSCRARRSCSRACVSCAVAHGKRRPSPSGDPRTRAPSTARCTSASSRRRVEVLAGFRRHRPRPLQPEVRGLQALRRRRLQERLRAHLDVDQAAAPDLGLGDEPAQLPLRRAPHPAAVAAGPPPVRRGLVVEPVQLDLPDLPALVEPGQLGRGTEVRGERPARDVQLVVRLLRRDEVGPRRHVPRVGLGHGHLDRPQPVHQRRQLGRAVVRPPVAAAVQVRAQALDLGVDLGDLVQLRRDPLPLRVDGARRHRGQQLQLHVRVHRDLLVVRRADPDRHPRPLRQVRDHGPQRVVDRDVRRRDEQHPLPARTSSSIAFASTRVLPVPGGPHTSRTPGLRHARYASTCAGSSPSTVASESGTPASRPSASASASGEGPAAASPSFSLSTRNRGDIDRAHTYRRRPGSPAGARSTSTPSTLRRSSIGYDGESSGPRSPAKHGSTSESGLIRLLRMSSISQPSRCGVASPTQRHALSPPRSGVNAAHRSTASMTSPDQSAAISPSLEHP
ncbi:hypothetical protein BJF78_33610 [Pseudonocardia sp. CNS-139]|nr:hypothetical protein BJF78_33610 [Pseudonocardia sp. CNS-139]